MSVQSDEVGRAQESKQRFAGGMGETCCDTGDNARQAARVAAAQHIKKDSLQGGWRLFRDLEKPPLQRHENRLQDVGPDGGSPIQIPKSAVDPLPARRAIRKPQLDFKRGLETVGDARIRIPVNAVIED